MEDGNWKFEIGGRFVGFSAENPDETKKRKNETCGCGAVFF
jgi:hypothetical protein